MSVISAVEEIESKAGKRGARSFSVTRAFKVITDSNTDQADTVLLSPLLPYPNQPLPGNAFMIVKDMSATPIDGDARAWRVVVEYGEADGAPQIDSDGVDLRPSVSFGVVSTDKAVDKAYATGTEAEPTVPIVNSAGTPFDPPIMIESDTTLISITVNRRSWQALWPVRFRGTVNSQDMKIAGIDAKKGTLLMRKIGAEGRLFGQGVRGVTATFEIEYNPKGHQVEVLDRGFYSKYDTELTHIVDSVTGKEVTEPALLDGNGLPLASVASPVFLKFIVRRSVSWRELDLPVKAPEKV